MMLESFVWKRFKKSKSDVLNLISAFEYCNCRKIVQRIVQSVKKQYNDFFKNKITVIHIKAKQKAYIIQNKCKTLSLDSQTFSPSGSESSIASLK